MTKTYDLPERNTFLFPSDPNNPDNPHPDTSEFQTDIRAIEREGSIWITLANLSIEIEVKGDNITITTSPLSLEAEDSYAVLNYEISGIEQDRSRKANTIENWTGDPYTPYTPPPSVPLT